MDSHIYSGPHTHSHPARDNNGAANRTKKIYPSGCGGFACNSKTRHLHPSQASFTVTAHSPSHAQLARAAYSKSPTARRHTSGAGSGSSRPRRRPSRAALTSDALQNCSRVPASRPHGDCARCPRILFHSPTKQLIPTSAQATALAHEPLLPPRASSTDPRTSTSDEALASAPSLASAPLLTSRRLGALTSLSPVRARRLSIAAPPWHIHARTRSSYARALRRTRPLTPCHMRTRTRPHRGVELSQMR